MRAARFGPGNFEIGLKYRRHIPYTTRASEAPTIIPETNLPNFEIPRPLASRNKQLNWKNMKNALESIFGLYSNYYVELIIGLTQIHGVPMRALFSVPG